MSDPFSVVGTAVGITSLGIQVCQGLTRYYAQFKSFQDDISSTVERIEHLERILEVLGQRLKNPAENETIADEVMRAILDCEVGLQRLERLVKKCGEINMPVTLEDRGRLVRKRLLYPFRKDSLHDLNQTLDRLQAKLQLAIQAFQLEDSIRRERSMVPIVTTLVHQSNSIQGNIESHTDILSSLDTKLDNLSLFSLHNENRQETSTNDINAKCDAIMAMQNQLAQYLHHLSDNTARIRSTNNLPPSAIRDVCDTYRKLTPKAGMSYHRQSVFSNISHRMNSSYRRSPGCTCSGIFPSPRRTQPRNFSFFWRKTSEHRPSCPYHSVSQRADALGVQLTVYGRHVRYLLEAAFTYHRGAGGRSIGSGLTYSAKVTWRSPAFNLTHRFRVIVCSNPIYELGGTTYIDCLELYRRGMLQLFQRGHASPYDKLWKSEQNLFHIVSISGPYRGFELCYSYINCLLELGVPYDEVDNFGCSGLDSLIHYSWDAEICIHIARLGASWTGAWVGSPQWYVSDSYRYTKYSSSEDMILNLRASRLKTTVLQQSESRLSQALSSCDDELEELDLLIHATSWPKGLKLLLQDGSRDVRALDKEGHGILDYACASGEPESVRILLASAAPLTNHTWRCAVFSRNAEIKRSIAHAIKEQSSVFDDSFSVEQEILSQVKPSERMFHFCVSLDDADMLYEIGFVDVTLSTGYWGTPMMYHARCLESHRYKSDIAGMICELQLLKWLEQKGADLDTLSPPSTSVPPRYVVADSLTEIFSTYLRAGSTATIDEILSSCRENGVLDFVVRLLSSTALDSCRCACSTRGCSVFAGLFKNISPCDFRGPVEFFFWKMEVQVSVGILREMIRTITFDELGLTHTCHRPYEDNRRDDEITEIQYIEQADIALLDGLVEEFTTAWPEPSPGSLLEFLDGYWKERMKQIHAARSNVSQYDVQKLEDIGVDLQEPSEESERQVIPFTMEESELFGWCLEVCKVTGFNDLVDQFLEERGYSIQRFRTFLEQESNLLLA